MGIEDALAGDSIMKDALVRAITEAFFEQKSYYDVNGGGQTYYGGQSVKLVERILSEPNTRAIIDKIIGNIGERLEALSTDINEAIKKKTAGQIEDKLREGSYDLSNAIRVAINSRYTSIVQELVNNDESIKKKIEELYKAGEYKITFNIQVNVTPADKS